MIKFCFFFKNCLRNATFDIILINSIVCSFMQVDASEAIERGNDDSSIKITVRETDVQRLKELNQLREETGHALETIKRIELENRALRQKKADLEAELFEIKEKFLKQNVNYRQLQLWLAGVPAEGAVRKSDQREEQLLQAMGAVAKDGSEFAIKVVSFCEEVQQLLKELSIGKVRQAEINLQLDELLKDARRFIASAESCDTASNGLDSLRSCRILAVNRDLSIVVLSVGSVKGAFAGMIYRVGKDRQIQLRVVSVRPYVAAAEVVKGTIGDLAPGMEAVAGESRELDKPGK